MFKIKILNLSMKAIKIFFARVIIYLFFSILIVIASNIIQLISEYLFNLREVQISYLFITILSIISSNKISEIIKKVANK